MFNQTNGMDWFYAFWSVLDVIFSYIDQQFRNVFSSIPPDAIQFLIGIYCYILLTVISIFIQREEEHKVEIILTAIYGFFTIITMAFTIWRIGIINSLRGLNFNTITQFIINLVYIAFFIVLIFAFYQKTLWLKKSLLILLWVLFTLTTWVLSPALTEFELTWATTTQFFTTMALFGVFESLYELKFKEKKEKDDK
jgi:hypothetical protein